MILKHLLLDNKPRGWDPFYPWTVYRSFQLTRYSNFFDVVRLSHYSSSILFHLILFLYRCLNLVLQDMIETIDIILLLIDDRGGQVLPRFDLAQDPLSDRITRPKRCTPRDMFKRLLQFIKNLSASLSVILLSFFGLFLYLFTDS